MSKKKYGEPWTIEDCNPQYIRDRNDQVVGSMEWNPSQESIGGIIPGNMTNDEWKAKRVVECVNACADIPNPAETLREMRAILEELAEMDTGEQTCLASEAKTTLAKLNA